MTRRDTLLFGVACAVLAALARVPGLGRSLWYDELFTLVHFSGSLGAAVGEQVGANNHPLASVATWLARSVGAASPEALRAPSVALGVLAVVALVAQRSLLGARAAGLACAFAALAPWHVAYAQQLRGYAGLLLAVTALPPLLALAWRQASPRVLVALALTAALGTYAHASFAAVVVAAIPLALLAPRWGWVARPASVRAALALGVGLALSALALLPLWARTAKRVRGMLRDGDLGAPGRLGLADAATVLGDGQRWLAATLAALALVGLWRLARRQPAHAAVVALPWAAAALALVCGAPAYPRFLLIALPATLGLAAVGLGGLPRPLAAALTVAVLLGSADRVADRAQAELQDYAGAGRLARELSPAGPPLALRAGSSRLLRVVCAPAPVEVADLAALDAWLSLPGPGVVIDDFPALTDPARRARVRARCGAPWLLPGRVTPIAVYRRGSTKGTAGKP